MSSEYRCLMCYVSFIACVNTCRVVCEFTDGGVNIPKVCV